MSTIIMTAFMLLSRITSISGRALPPRGAAAFIVGSSSQSQSRLHDHDALTSSKRQVVTSACAAPSSSSRRTSRSSTMLPIAESTQQQSSSSSSSIVDEPFKINLLTLPLPELETLLKSWGHPAFRARQIHNKLFEQGVTNINDMSDLPKSLRAELLDRATIGSLQLSIEQISTDGTKKRAYKLHDGQMIESVLMPYEDGRRTACISSQAGCAMGCVFCATGQMGFARQLTAEEIYEQVARFASELKGEGERLSNVVMMGMGEPLANYRNVIAAIRRMNTELGIGARKITVSTVGVVPSIKKLMNEDIQVRLAVSLHCATDEERTALLPANKRYGGLDELMVTIKEYVTTKKQRVTFEWALIEGENDTPEVARTLGRLLKRHGIRSDMAHVNLIPLNPTGGFGGGPSGRANVNRFVEVLEREFSVSATPRMRRGIDINAGCGQLTASVKKKEDSETQKQQQQMLGIAIPEVGSLPEVGIYEDEEEGDEEETGVEAEGMQMLEDWAHGSIVDFSVDDGFVDLDDEDVAEDFEDPTYEDDYDLAEAERLLSLIKGSSLQPQASPDTSKIDSPSSDDDELHPLAKTKTSTITDEDAVRKAKRRRKKLLKNMKAIKNLADKESAGGVLNQEQLDKVARKKEWQDELESIEHNLM